jgi:hypothetical protein
VDYKKDQKLVFVGEDSDNFARGYKANQDQHNLLLCGTHGRLEMGIATCCGDQNRLGKIWTVHLYIFIPRPWWNINSLLTCMSNQGYYPPPQGTLSTRDVSQAD